MIARVSIGILFNWLRSWIFHCAGTLATRWLTYWISCSPTGCTRRCSSSATQTTASACANSSRWRRAPRAARVAARAARRAQAQAQDVYWTSRRAPWKRRATSPCASASVCFYSSNVLLILRCTLLSLLCVCVCVCERNLIAKSQLVFWCCLIPSFHKFIYPLNVSRERINDDRRSLIASLSLGHCI